MSAYHDLLPWRLRGALIQGYLHRRRVRCAGLPAFDAEWPIIHNEGLLELGTDCHFRFRRIRHLITVYSGATLAIGTGTLLNDGVNICARQSIRIGDHAKIGDLTNIFDTDFHERSPGLGIRIAPVAIGRNVWVGSGAHILPGATIGDHSVIGAGSVVLGDIPARCMAAGAPARVISTFEAPDDWVRD